MNQTSPPDARERRRRARRLVKRLIAALVGAAVVAGVVVAALPKPVDVEQETASVGELVITVDEDGVTRVKDRYVVSAPLPGNVARIELRAGDEVKQGDVLARLVPLRAPLLDARSKSQAEAQVAAALAATRQVEAQIERAKAALDFARAESGRTRELFKRSALSQQELDRTLLEERARQAELTSAEFGAKVASHELRMARAALGHAQDKRESQDGFSVTSPVSGRVLKVIQASEGVVQPGTALLELGDPKALEIVVDVLTSDAVNIQPGSPARIEGWGGEPLPAAVRMVEPSAFTRVSALGVDEQRVNAIVDINAPYESWSKLGDGYRVEARIEIFRSKDSVRIPGSALFRHQGKWATFVVESSRAKLRVVEVGRRNDTHAEISSGIRAGEVVIVHPSDRIAEGVEVRRL